ncbi:NTP transferase domain-containing protein [Acidiferrimicrobium sp. IK]|uniref:bifunctional UDP-N-acetylglucosamine diphosphorylase/glucosamine-1-phosphate N-acetyltransferase GlmU n=1 Tax=Acidiferrimicrobium sp. IK TaxID=2871700 RepID=UPI0021CB583D|nr:sugar phosphate nucleotidyltransferase [Acidiferrimicrobium sp. IK]MCU4187085.1 NTP transferase domain-containing protein [Acidiferrimicrobium sp. IK]
MPDADSRHRSLNAVVLAAGEGTRMRSERPKPLHRLCGRPMVVHVLHAVAAAGARRAVVVVGFGAARVTKTVGEQQPTGLPIDFVEQARQRGTGDAVLVGLTGLPDDDDDEDVLVLPGDTPLLRGSTLAGLVGAHRDADAAATVLTARVPDPTGYGRVVRGKGDRVARIVEQSDATAEELAIDEINTSIYVFRRSVLAPALRRLTPDNAQGEYYLTDAVAVLHDAGYDIAAVAAADRMEATGVNDRVQLATAEAELRRRINDDWLRRGVTMVDPARTYLDTTVTLAPDVTLYPGTMLQGSTTVAAGAEIGPDSQLADCAVGARAVVTATVAHGASVGADAQVGPWGYLPPGSTVAPGAVTGPCFTGRADTARDT